MKKIVSIFFLVIYSLTTVGTTVNAHYCMGEFVGTSTFHNVKDKCGKCGMTKAKAKDCCSDEVKFVQVKKEHQQNISSSEIPSFFVTPQLHNDPCFNLLTSDEVVAVSVIIHPPPIIHKQRLHLLNNVFLI